MKFDAEASSEMKWIPYAPQRISHCEAIFHMRSVFHKSRKGFISLKKTDALYQSIGLFLAEKEGLEPSRRFPDLRP